MTEENISRKQQYLKKQLKEHYKKLIKGVEEIANSERWKEFLKVYSSFHKYSFANTVLIVLQKPDASLVAGYKTWQKLGRQVRRGEKAIKIYAPLIKKVKVKKTKREIVKTPEGEEKEMEIEIEDIEEILVGFRLVNVFDISQTVGKPLPKPIEFKVKDIVKGTDEYSRLEILTNIVKNIAESIGYKVEVIPESPYLYGGAYGVTVVDKKLIQIRDTGNLLQMEKTLLHELTHAMLREDNFTSSKTLKTDIDNKILNYNDEEVIVESTAFIVLSYLGYDTSSYSFYYILSYASKPQLLLDLGDLIQKYSSIIIDKINKLLGV
jgi:antirestriction protein ArdC